MCVFVGVVKLACQASSWLNIALLFYSVVVVPVIFQVKSVVCDSKNVVTISK